MMIDEKILEVLALYEAKLTPPPVSHLSKWCLPATPPAQAAHGWCANRSADETSCTCPCHRDKQLVHLLEMIPKIRGMLGQAREHIENYAAGQDDWAGLKYGDLREKLMRWLGFIQGTLCTKGVYTIDELRAHNKPDNEVFRPQ